MWIGKSHRKRRNGEEFIVVSKRRDARQFPSPPVGENRKSWDQEKWVTLPETNIAPKNGWLEYYFPIGKAYFQGLC